jgi:hypothetical protein
MVQCISEACEGKAKRNKEFCEECLELDIIPHNNHSKMDTAKTGQLVCEKCGDQQKATRKGKKICVKCEDSMDMSQTTSKSSAHTDDAVDIAQKLTDFTKSFDQKFEGLKRSMTEDIHNAIEAAVSKQIDKLRVEMKKDIGNLTKRVTAVETCQKNMEKEQVSLTNKQTTLESDVSDLKQKSVREDDKALLIVIRRLPEREDENVLELVNSLISDGIKLTDVKVTEAERKQSYHDSQPGLVIAKCASMDDKRQIMSNKKGLRQNEQYQNVMIDPPKTFSSVDWNLVYVTL